MILALFPEILSNGGIQRMSQHVCAVLQEMADVQGETCCLFSLNDPKGLHHFNVEGRKFEVRGFARKKGNFSRAVISRIAQCRLLYIAHPNLAPLGLIGHLINPSLQYVVTAHGAEVWERLPLLRRLSLRYANSLTAVSNSTAQEMVRVQGVDPLKITVVANAVSQDLLNANGHGVARNGIEPKMLLTVGRLDTRERRKGLDEVILALAELNTMPDLVFVIAGDGDDRGRLEMLAKDHGVSERVIFKGVVTDEELVALYERCDVFVMPSRQEGFGIVFLEAMAFKKPVIGGNHGGTPEVILDNTTGYLVEHGDVDTLAHRISQLLADPELCKRMGEAGRRRLEEHYTFEALRKRLMSLFAQVQGPQQN